MKRTVAIILSLTVIWLQVLASAQTLSNPTPAQSCGCCTSKQACCCVEQSAPDAAPVPAAPASSHAALDLTAVLPKLLAWTLPATAPAKVSSFDRSSSLLAVPLFTRHCALLI